jgi:hypothetical protein
MKPVLLKTPYMTCRGNQGFKISMNHNIRVTAEAETIIANAMHETDY